MTHMAHRTMESCDKTGNLRLKFIIYSVFPFRGGGGGGGGPGGGIFLQECCVLSCYGALKYNMATVL